MIPSYENKGIGQEAIKFIESQFPNATAFTLEAPADKKRNHYFYKKMGYTIEKEYMNGSVKLVFMRKKLIIPERLILICKGCNVGILLWLLLKLLRHNNVNINKVLRNNKMYLVINNILLKNNKIYVKINVSIDR